MKTAEELLKEKGITPETVHHNYAYVYRVVCDLIGEAQKEGYKEAMRWRDPEEELPELLPGCDYSNNVLAQVEGFTETQVMCLLFIPDDEGGWGYVWGNCYGDINGEAEWDDDYEIIGWRPIE